MSLQQRFLSDRGLGGGASSPTIGLHGEACGMFDTELTLANAVCVGASGSPWIFGVSTQSTKSHADSKGLVQPSPPQMSMRCSVATLRCRQAITLPFLYNAGSMRSPSP